METSVLTRVSLKKWFVLAAVCVLSLGSFAQTVTIVPTGTVAKPNLIPVNNSVSFSINPLGFGNCMNRLSYKWAILNAANDTLYKSTASNPVYNFTTEGVFTVVLSVTTLPGGSCTANVTRSATSVIKVAKEGAGGAPKPNLYSVNALGTTVSAYAMDENGQLLSGPYDHFDPFPADNAVTAALAMDDKGNYFYLPTFMNGTTVINAAGVVEVWAVDKKTNKPPVVIARFDMNGASTTELGLYRMGLDKNGNAWILAGDGTTMYAATFATDGTNLVKPANISTYIVPFESGAAVDFQSGDLAFDNNGTMYVLAGSSTGTHIYTMSTSTGTPVLAKKWRVMNPSGSNFGLSVTGTVFDAKGNMFFSALDGIYFIAYYAVNPTTGTAMVKKVSENFGLMDLATSQFPAAWTPPFDPVVLPVKLIQFAGQYTAGKAHLTWSVTGNENGSHFELEKSTNGRNFETQTLIFNTEKQGNEAYTFADAASLSEKVYYRLKIVNKNKSVSYSNIVLLGQAKGASALTLLQNPVQSAVNFTYTAAENTAAEVTVYNLAGVKVLSQKQYLQKGTNSVAVPVGNALTEGIYILEVREGSNRQTVKFVKQ